MLTRLSHCQAESQQEHKRCRPTTQHAADASAAGTSHAPLHSVRILVSWGCRRPERQKLAGRGHAHPSTRTKKRRVFILSTDLATSPAGCRGVVKTSATFDRAMRAYYPRPRQGGRAMEATRALWQHEKACGSSQRGAIVSQTPDPQFPPAPTPAPLHQGFNRASLEARGPVRPRDGSRSGGGSLLQQILQQMDARVPPSC